MILSHFVRDTDWNQVYHCGGGGATPRADITVPFVKWSTPTRCPADHRRTRMVTVVQVRESTVTSRPGRQDNDRKPKIDIRSAVAPGLARIRRPPLSAGLENSPVDKTPLHSEGKHGILI
ncbi:MAG: hypothetical protein GF363_13910 [Chitinivibrionales bacterium]|nr:hypothetical protein [Chitinivibrionales bacterium]